MRVVPENRLLIQPTVQLKWLEQHGQIEFIVGELLLDRFEQLWQLLIKTEMSFSEFLMTEESTEWLLQDDDFVFALITGADYIKTRYPSFHCDKKNSRLIWSITV